MAVHPLVTLNDITPELVPDPTERFIQGKPARLLASAQGRCWEGVSEDHAIIERSDVAEIIDAQGDSLARMLAQLLTRMAATARREGAYQTEAMCHEGIAVFVRLCEMDDHEDDHRHQIRAHAIGATAATLDASQTIGAVIGQRDAVCGKTRGEAGGIEFEPCSQPAGHATDGKVCVFLARAPKSGSRQQRGAGE